MTETIAQAASSDQTAVAEAILIAQTEFLRALVEASSHAEAFDLCLKAALRAGDLDCGGIYLVDPQSGELRLAAGIDLPPDFLQTAAQFHGESWSTQAAMVGEPIQGDPRSLHRAQSPSRSLKKLGSMGIFPIRRAGRTIASLNVAAFRSGAITEAVVKLLEAVAAQVAGVILRLQAESALGESEAKYRHLVENINDGLAVVREGRFLFVNRKLRELTGYVPEELLGRPTLEFIHPDDRPAFLERRRIRDAGGGYPNSFEARVVTKDGRTRWFRFSVSPIVWEGAPAFLSFYSDVTKNKEAEEALRETEERFRRAFDQSPMGVAIVAPDGRFLRTNETLGRILGYSQEELLTLTTKAITPAEDRPQCSILGHRLLDGLVQQAQVEKRYLRRDGRTVWVRLSLSLVRDRTNQPQYFIALFEDVTERQRATELLERSLKEKEVLLREVHHRVKNNMQVMVSLLSLQAERVKEPQARTILQEGQSWVRAMALIHESLYQSADLSHVALDQYLAKLAAALRTIHGGHPGVRLVLRVSPLDLSLDQAVPCGLVVNELVTNAYKHAFLEGRGGTILVKAGLTGSGEAWISVRDDGRGLPPGLEFRAAGTLGLPLVVGLVERQMGGRIEVDSSAGLEFNLFFRPEGA